MAKLMTRTIKNMKLDVAVYDKNTKVTGKTQVNIGFKNYSDDEEGKIKLEKDVQKYIGNDMKVLDVNIVEVREQLYALSEEEFLKYAKPLNRNKTQEVDN